MKSFSTFINEESDLEEKKLFPKKLFKTGKPMIGPKGSSDVADKMRAKSSRTLAAAVPRAALKGGGVGLAAAAIAPHHPVFAAAAAGINGVDSFTKSVNRAIKYSDKARKIEDRRKGGRRPGSSFNRTGIYKESVED